LNPGDTVFFSGGQIFTGSILIDSTKIGSTEKPVVITSSAADQATVQSGNNMGITVYNTSFVHIENLNFTGSGRKSGNTKNGVFIINSNNINLNNIDVKGYQKSGLEIYSCHNVVAEHIRAHENGASGISVSGVYDNKNATTDILLNHCIAENNPGDPTNLTNHSGNGIIAGNCRKVTIEYCTATNNGWDMPRTGNGPVGIWMYEADSVLIQYCISYRNKTSKGAADGGGFDIDGGVTNSTIQYCLSYENYGSGFGIFQYYEASPWYNNTIRYCISENDGLVSDAHAGVHIWNAQGDSTKFHHSYFYNNTIYNSKGAAISYSELNKNKDFYFYNNIFVAKDSLIKGGEYNGTYLGNDWWSLGRFSIEGRRSLKKWATGKNKEQQNGRLAGLEINPGFKAPGKASLTDPDKLATFINYNIPVNSPLHTKGVALRSFGIIPGDKDFNQHLIRTNGIGACF
ncbi:MAG TPA: right-handed parallel beta-helix repeat-containing protein, partial [Flavisolibacter sp.]|nr:right-handed parallel beta-helix repeat-containing protein [Flavisolibacter sp.]